MIHIGRSGVARILDFVLAFVMAPKKHLGVPLSWQVEVNKDMNGVVMAKRSKIIASIIAKYADEELWLVSRWI